MAPNGFVAFAANCDARIQPALERRPGNALNVEIGLPSARCTLRTPDHWPESVGAGRWLLSGGSPLVLGCCTRAGCPRWTSGADEGILSEMKNYSETFGASPNEFMEDLGRKALGYAEIGDRVRLLRDLYLGPRFFPAGSKGRIVSEVPTAVGGASFLVVLAAIDGGSLSLGHQFDTILSPADFAVIPGR